MCVAAVRSQNFTFGHMQTMVQITSCDFLRHNLFEYFRVLMAIDLCIDILRGKERPK